MHGPGGGPHMGGPGMGGFGRGPMGPPPPRRFFRPWGWYPGGCMGCGCAIPCVLTLAAVITAVLIWVF